MIVGEHGCGIVHSRELQQKVVKPDWVLSSSFTSIRLNTSSLFAGLNESGRDIVRKNDADAPWNRNHKQKLYGSGFGDYWSQNEHHFAF